jgi:hypothetical protein
MIFNKRYFVRLRPPICRIAYRMISLTPSSHSQNFKLTVYKHTSQKTLKSSLNTLLKAYSHRLNTLYQIYDFHVPDLSFDSRNLKLNLSYNVQLFALQTQYRLCLSIIEEYNQSENYDL